MVYDRWTLHIDKVTSDFLREFGSLTTFELNWKPRADVWSIAQTIDHLTVINKTFFPLVHALRVGQYKPPFIAKFKFLVERSGQYILDAVQCDRIERMKTFPIWQPNESAADENIFDKLKQHQRSLIQLVLDSYDLLDKDAVISSPANRLLVYRLSTAFDIIVAQEKRHFDQALEVLGVLKRMATVRQNAARIE